jgi:hypothetical protein
VLLNVTEQLTKLAGVRKTTSDILNGSATSIPIVPSNEPVITAGTGFSIFDKINATLDINWVSYCSLNSHSITSNNTGIIINS